MLTVNQFNIQFHFPTLYYNSKLVEIGHENFPKKKKVSKFYQNNPTLKMPLNMEIIYIYIKVDLNYSFFN